MGVQVFSVVENSQPSVGHLCTAEETFCWSFNHNLAGCPNSPLRLVNLGDFQAAEQAAFTPNQLITHTTLLMCIYVQVTLLLLIVQTSSQNRVSSKRGCLLSMLLSD